MEVTHIKTWIVTNHPINTREGWREFRRAQKDVFGTVSEPSGREFFAANGRYSRESYTVGRVYFFSTLNEPLSERLRRYRSRRWIVGCCKYRYHSQQQALGIAAE